MAAQSFIAFKVWVQMCISGAWIALCSIKNLRKWHAAFCNNQLQQCGAMDANAHHIEGLAN